MFLFVFWVEHVGKRQSARRCVCLWAELMLWLVSTVPSSVHVVALRSRQLTSPVVDLIFYILLTLILTLQQRKFLPRAEAMVLKWNRHRTAFLLDLDGEWTPVFKGRSCGDAESDRDDWGVDPLYAPRSGRVRKVTQSEYWLCANLFQSVFFKL